jgi:hypothetical protein
MRKGEWESLLKFPSLLCSPKHLCEGEESLSREASAQREVSGGLEETEGVGRRGDGEMGRVGDRSKAEIPRQRKGEKM